MPRIPTCIWRTCCHSHSRGPIVPADSAIRPFGIGTNHSYGIFLWSAQQYQQVDLILPDGGRIHYVRTSPGTGWADAVFEHTTTPSAFYKSIIRWNGRGWDLTLKDGTVYVFGENAPLQAIRDRHGNTTTVAHANGQAGNITRVTSPNGRWIAFSYDRGNRIVQAQDNGGRTVSYTYDGPGRLSKVTDPNGGLTTYTYDSSHRMLSITNPRGVTFVTNQYDANGRVSEQTHADGGVYRFAYALDGNGTVTRTDVHRSSRRGRSHGFQRRRILHVRDGGAWEARGADHDVDTRCPVESGPLDDRFAESPDGVYLRHVGQPLDEHSSGRHSRRP